MEKGYITIDGEKRKISTPVSFHDLSAHADIDDILNYVKKSSPNKVVCVHGDPDSATTLADKLAADGFETFAPKIGDTIKVD